VACKASLQLEQEASFLKRTLDRPRFRLQQSLTRAFGWRSLLLFLLCFCLALSQPFLLAQTSVPSPKDRSISGLVGSGQGLFQSGQYERAATAWQQAAEVYGARGDRLNQAMALSNLSLTEQQLGQWDRATQALNQSLGLLQGQNSTPAQQILAATLDIQGQLQRATGQSKTALKTWEQAADLYEKVGDRGSATSARINQAQALQDLGLYPRACQTVLEALTLPHKGCEISESSLQNLNVQTAKPFHIVGLRSLGNILRAVGQPEQSQMVLQKSWQLAKASDDTQNMAAIALSLGNTARIAGNKASSVKQKLASTAGTLLPANCLSTLTPGTATAAQYYQQAASCYRQAETSAAPSIVTQAQLNLLSLGIQTQYWSLIPELLPKIQTQLAQLPPSRNTLTAQLKLAQNLMCLQSAVNPAPSSELSKELSKFPSPLLESCPAVTLSENALQRSQIPGWPEIQTLVSTALQQAQSLKDKESEANALGYLAAISQQTGHPSEAQTLTEQVLQKISAFDKPELAYLWQWQLGRLHQLQGREKEAIAAYTLSFETLQSLRRDLVAADSDIQFTFRDSVEPVYRELVDLQLGATPSQENLKQARDVIESLQLAELNNFFREACLDAHPQPIDRLDPNAAVLYGVILPQRLAVILSMPGKPLLYYETPLKAALNGTTGEIDNTVDDLFATLNPFITASDPLKPNQKIYDWLIRPAEAELQTGGIKTLVFVLDGVLRGVPVAALHDGKQFLIEKYRLALTPGLQLLSSQSLSTLKLKTLVGGLAEARQGFASLPGVQQEIKDIAGVVPTDVLLNGNFTRNRLQTAIETAQFPVIHLATHAQFSSRAEDTFLLTWDERVNVKNLDRFLKDRDRPGRKPIELLILSACQTAVGDKRAALGLAGVAVRSGARSTVATLWSVQDRSTADLMTRFYGALNKTGGSKAESLRQAQIALLKSSEYSNPYYWAPFVLVGNWL
jgi:CHAT domain-containing protein